MATDSKTSKSQTIASDGVYDFTCTPCSDDGRNTEALFQCFDCQIFYCKGCVIGHNKFTKNHNVLDVTKTLEQGQEQPRSVSSSELPTDLCKEHHGEVIKMYCGQHDLVCCTVCIAVKHRSCKCVDYIPNVAKGLLKGQDKDKTKTYLAKVKDDLQKLKSEMQNELKELNKQRGGILDEIQKFKKSIIERVEELEKKSIKEVEDTHTAIADDITASCKTIDDLLEDVEKHLDKLKHSNSGNEAQSFVDIKFGEKKLSDGSKCIRESNAIKVKTLEFEVNRSLEEYLLQVKSLGELTVTNAADVNEIDGVEEATVLTSYEAENEYELTIEVGDIIYILDKELEDKRWWKGILRGKIGVFPNNFVTSQKQSEYTKM